VVNTDFYQSKSSFVLPFCLIPSRLTSSATTVAIKADGNQTTCFAPNLCDLFYHPHYEHIYPSGGEPSCNGGGRLLCARLDDIQVSAVMKIRRALQAPRCHALRHGNACLVAHTCYQTELAYVGFCGNRHISVRPTHSQSVVSCLPSRVR
jgi:hypothetical protein